MRNLTTDGHLRANCQSVSFSSCGGGGVPTQKIFWEMMTRAPTTSPSLSLPSLTAIRARTSQKSYSGQCFAITCLGTCLLYLTHSIISGSSESLLSRGPATGGPWHSFFHIIITCRGPHLMTFDEACVISSLPPSTMYAQPLHKNPSLKY